MTARPSSAPHAPTGLGRLAAACFDHRRLVVALWSLALAGVIAVATVAGGELKNDFSSSDSPSGRAQALLARSFPSQAGDSAQLVVHAPGSVRSPRSVARTDRLIAALRPLPHVGDVLGPFDRGAEDQVSADGTIAYAVVQFDQRSDALPKPAVERVIETALRFRAPGFQVALDGDPISNVANVSPGSSEAIGILAAVVVMLVAFGSLIAMGLPILIALLGVGIGFGLIDLLSRLIIVPTFGPELMAMIGLGVGIDYALFIVTRHRAGLRAGMTPRAATIVALGTSGRAVAFAGTTVVISLLGLFLIEESFLDGLALASIFAVLAVLLGSLTLLPALFGFCGEAIDRTGLPAWWPRVRRAPGRRTSGSFWQQWSRLVQHHPLPYALAATALIGLLIVPFFSMRLAFADAGNDPSDQTTRQAFDLLSRGFGAGANGPLVVAIKLPGRGSVPIARALERRIAATTGVAAATPARIDPKGGAAVVIVTPTTAPSAAPTVDLVHRLRDEVIPSVVAGSRVQALVGGETAAGVDSSTHISARLPLVIGLVILLSFLLLGAVFRSIAIPIKAAAMNLLSIGAAYGVIVAVFQWGWGIAAFGGTGKGPIDPWIPLMMFVVTFGLSMDYEVFLLSAMQEEWERTHDSAGAVADGLARTAKVISAAALIMVCVFGSFVVDDPLRILDVFGLGLAVAILVDATIIRLVLVPAVMELLGDRAWWMPGWLRRNLPRSPLGSGPSEGGR